MQRQQIGWAVLSALATLLQGQGRIRSKKSVFRCCRSALLIACTLSIVVPSLVNANINIVGGKDATVGQFPHQVAIMNIKGKLCCGGSLIAPQWVLTAAHCINAKCIRLQETLIKAGIVNIGDPSAQTFKVSELHVHPDFLVEMKPDSTNVSKILNDIALLRLDHAAMLNGDVQTIRLSAGGQSEIEPSVVVASGWGSLGSDKPAPSNILQYVDLPIMNYEKCNDVFDSPLSPNEGCVDKDGHGTCNGDSGGPLIDISISKEPYLVGVVSTGSCDYGLSVFTRVTPFIDWIAATAGRDVPVPIFVYGTNLLLNAWGGTPKIASGSPVKLLLNGGTPNTNELWTFTSGMYNDGGPQTITTPSSKGVLCLAAQAGGRPLNELIVHDCTNSPNQQWIWHSSTSSIENAGTGQCLDASVNGIDSGNQLALAPCNPNILGQRFGLRLMTPVLPSLFLNKNSPIYAYGTNLLLNAWGGTFYINSGSPVKLLNNGGPPNTNELWTFNSDETITTPATGPFSPSILCLDSAHRDTDSPLNQLKLHSCERSGDWPHYNQRWRWHSSTGIIENIGTPIDNSGSGYCLDASVNGIGSGNQLALAPCNPNILGQRFWPQLMTVAVPADGQQSPIYAYGTNLLLNANPKTGLVRAPVNLNTNDGSPAENELWTFHSNGKITIPNYLVGALCLTANNVLLPGEAPSRLEVSYCEDNAPWTDDRARWSRQQWTWHISTSIIENSGTGYCLDASVNGIGSGNQLALAPCNPNILGQRFDTGKHTSF